MEKEHKAPKAAGAPQTGDQAHKEQGFNVLVVEDDVDVRAALAEILVTEGYGVIEAANATTGLEKLREGRVHLVISDYQLPPGEDGLWMLKQAASESLLTGTQVMIVSAQEKVEGAIGVRWLRKPVDVDTLLKEVATALAPVRTVEMLVATGNLQNAADAIAEGRSMDLTLFVNAAAPASLRAIHAFDEVRAGFDLSAVTVTIWDTSKAPPDLDEPISLVPSLVLRDGREEARLSGEIKVPDIENFLSDRGFRRRRADEEHRR